MKYEKFRYLTIPNFIYNLLIKQFFSIQYLILAQKERGFNIFCDFYLGQKNCVDQRGNGMIQ